MRNVFEIVYQKCEVFVQKSFSLKKYFEINNSQTRFCCLYVNLPTVKIWEQSDKFLNLVPRAFPFAMSKGKERGDRGERGPENEVGHFFAIFNLLFFIYGYFKRIITKKIAYLKVHGNLTELFFTFASIWSQEVSRCLTCKTA